MSFSLNLEGAIAGCRGDASLNAIAFAVFGAGPEVAYVPGLQPKHAGLADPHAAPERHLDANLFACFQK
jgi:hypothetical protein